MAIQVSPGIQVNEVDLTTTIPAVSTSIGAIAAAFRWGPANTITQVVSEVQLASTFGSPDSNTCNGFFTAASFLAYSNNLQVSRAVLPGSNAATTDSMANAINQFPNSIEYFNSDIYNSVNGDSTYGPFAARYIGSLGNSLAVYSWQGPNSWIANSNSSFYVSSSNTSSYLDANTKIKFNSGAMTVGGVYDLANNRISGGANTTPNAISNTAYVGATVTVVNGTTANSTKHTVVAYDNVSSVITVTPNLASEFVNGSSNIILSVPDPLYRFASLFDYPPTTTPTVLAKTGIACNDEIHILVVDNNGLISGQQNTVLERYQSLSTLSDATAPDGSNNYYKNILFRNSKYIYWTSPVGANATNFGKTVASITNNSATWPSNDPVGNVASFGGGSDGNYADKDSALINAYSQFASSETIDISLVLTADANIPVVQYVVQDLIGTAGSSGRADCIALLSPPLLNSLGQAGDSPDPSVSIVNYTNSLGAFSSYAVMDSGWKYTYDKYNDIYRWIPLNGDIAGLCAYTDNVKDPWWSPAGLQRGTIKNVIKLAFNPNQAQRDTLYKAGVNPVVSFPGQGTLLYGDKTMQNRPSAFDRINVRRLFLVLEKTISKAAQSSLFEFNDTFTQSQFIGLVDPFLRTVQGRRGIYAYRIVCDSTNNTPAIVDANQFVGDIYVQPARSINFITLNFVATRTGVAFSEVVGKF
jgi:Phage tail sheath protein subtilisin-like domain/Phage tail sheath C-terminal domain